MMGHHKCLVCGGSAKGFESGHPCPICGGCRELIKADLRARGVEV